MTLTKAWVNGKTGDAVSLNITGATSAVAGNSTVGGTTTNATATGYAGSTISLVESFTTGVATNYTTSLSCTKDSDGSTVSVSSNSITMPDDSAVTCTYSNTGVVVSVSGRVFADNGGTTGLTSAYDGVQNSGETGIANSTVQLTDCSTTVVATTQSNASGDYNFNVYPSQLPSPDFCVVQTNLPSYTSVSGTTGYTRNTDTISLSNTGASSYTANNFGDANISVVLTEDGQHTVSAGSVTDYPHRLKAQSPVEITALTQTVTQQPDATSGQAWQALVYLDSNCNGTVDAGEAIFNPTTTSPVQLQSGVDVCLVQRVFAPSNVYAGAKHIATLQASYAVDLSNPSETVTGNTAQHQDITLVSSAGGALDLQKKVRTVATCPSTAADTTVFALENQATKLDKLEYEITYKNNSVKGLENVNLKDSVPTGTTFGSISCESTPTGNTCNATQTGDALLWQLTGVLAPSATGTVRFCVSPQ